MEILEECARVTRHGHDEETHANLLGEQHDGANLPKRIGLEGAKVAAELSSGDCGAAQSVNSGIM